MKEVTDYDVTKLVIVITLLLSILVFVTSMIIHYNSPDFLSLFIIEVLFVSIFLTVKFAVSRKKIYNSIKGFMIELQELKEEENF